MIQYMNNLWAEIDGTTITVGLLEEAVSDISQIKRIELPEDEASVEAHEVCGELYTDQGPINLYCPVASEVREINAAVNDDPSLILEDPQGEAWLFKVEADEEVDVDELIQEIRDLDE